MKSYELQITISKRLVKWGVANAVLNTLLFLPQNGFTTGLAIQGIVWGLINTTIALAGLWHGRGRMRGANSGAFDPGRDTQRTKKFILLLWVNFALDIIYILTGALIALFYTENALWLGHGTGIVIQGSFLLVFDLYHALICRRTIHGSDHLHVE